MLTGRSLTAGFTPTIWYTRFPYCEAVRRRATMAGSVASGVAMVAYCIRFLPHPLWTVLVLPLAGLASAQTLEITNRHEPLPGITTAGQPNAAALEAAATAGYKAVIDLRGLAEDRGFDERGAVERLGMTYVTLPVDGAAGVTYENAAELDRLLAKLPKPLLLHCSSANRAGALLALRAKLNGADDAAALELGVAAGLAGLKPTVEQKLAAPPTR